MVRVRNSMAMAARCCLQYSRGRSRIRTLVCAVGIIDERPAVAQRGHGAISRGPSSPFSPSCGFEQRSYGGPMAWAEHHCMNLRPSVCTATMCSISSARALACAKSVLDRHADEVGEAFSLW